MNNVRLSIDQISRIARSRQCPRCGLDKSPGDIVCELCRRELPEHMRIGLEAVDQYDSLIVQNAIRAAASYFDLHFQSIRNFGGGRND